MTKHAAGPLAQAHIEARRARILDQLNRTAQPIEAGGDRLPRERLEYLVREAEELYWNELAWEELTDEERVTGGHLTELVFPGFLAFVDGLLLDSSPPGVFERPVPRREVVEEILLFLGDRYASTTRALEQGADSERLVWARAMTAHLIDLVLLKLYRVTAQEREDLEPRG
jgi:hypothetical protein